MFTPRTKAIFLSLFILLSCEIEPLPRVSFPEVRMASVESNGLDVILKLEINGLIEEDQADEAGFIWVQLADENDSSIPEFNNPTSLPNNNIPINNPSIISENRAYSVSEQFQEGIYRFRAYVKIRGRYKPSPNTEDITVSGISIETDEGVFRNGIVATAKTNVIGIKSNVTDLIVGHEWSVNGTLIATTQKTITLNAGTTAFTYETSFHNLEVRKNFNVRGFIEIDPGMPIQEPSNQTYNLELR